MSVTYAHEHHPFARYYGNGQWGLDLDAFFHDTRPRPSFKARLLYRAHECIIPRPEQLRADGDVI